MIIDNKEVNSIDIKLLLNKVGLEIFMKALEIKRIYYNKLMLNNSNKDNIEEIVCILDETVEKILEIEKNKECYQIKDLDINGKDIESLGYRGKDIGEKLNILLNKVIENPELNKKEVLMGLI